MRPTFLCCDNFRRAVLYAHNKQIFPLRVTAFHFSKNVKPRFIFNAIGFSGTHQ